jgi:hypothetical protein
MRILDRKETDVDATTIEAPETELSELESPPAAVRGPQGFEFELPIGYVDADGRVHRTAVLRKMTGRDEAIMADRRNRNSGARMISELLSSCLIRLGEIEQPAQPVVRSLYSADRYYLLLQLRGITFGPELQATYACPTCRESLTLMEDIDSLEVRRLEGAGVPENIVVELEDGYYERTTGETHFVAVFRHPTGEDEERISAVSRENASLGKNALMARCIVELGGIPRQRLEVLGTSIFNDLTLGDRSRIDHALNDNAPGLEMDREHTCASCGRQFRTTLDLSVFLAPS